MIKNKGSRFYSGDQPIIIVQGNRHPDRRQISARWLIGTVLTGMTSCTLMGIALFAALDGREQLATPPELLGQNEISSKTYNLKGNKGDRLLATRSRRNFDDKRKLELSIVQKIGGREVIRSQTFELVDMTLAEKHKQNFDYPKFDALNLFADAPTPAETTTQIYGSKIETEITLQTIDFPIIGAVFDDTDHLSAEEVEHVLKITELGLSNNATQIAALHYISPVQLQTYNSSFGFSDTLDVKIIQENVSVLVGYTNDAIVKNYSEDIIPFSRNESIAVALHRANYNGEDVIRISEVLKVLMGNDKLDAGNVLRLGIKSNQFGKDYIVRVSIYKGKKHYLSVALNDHNQYLQCKEPEMTPLLRTTLEGSAPVIRIPSDKLPTIYDAVFQSAMSYDMTQEMIKQLIRMLANDVDMQSRASSHDSLKVFYTLPDISDEKTDREILYVSANFSGTMRRYYRFQSSDGKLDYYDAEGKNSKQFLLRKPVPNGVFRSPFGARRHPILGYMRMHTGVDWAAARGSPILAAGDGEIVKAAWSRGYGYHTEIRHANGYVSSYSHQNAFAKGIQPGMKVRQGQVIGYVGSTGLSTGPHCHFEIIVNGTKVDPMRIRLPDDKSLKGKELEAFKHDRDRIDALMNKSLSQLS
ncbi:MAG: hypothetical protein JSC189_000799 [Candidatus Tokpelaia sp. JSC189]|nr:MAG: hypothetical protein JSC189_000799 [Candidatus Tokpelaia sp. JSC189]